MTRDAQRVLDEALQLSESDRADVAAKLISSLAPESDDDADTAWALEIERRCAELDAGTAVTSDWDEVRRRIESALLGQR
jgi:putative addiction module component (TIGR02574 family)